jgi:amino acid permease
MDPKYSALFTSINMLLGVGPLILPYSFFEGGFLLSSIWMLLIIFISYNSAMYIVEAMSKVSHIDQKQYSYLTNSLISNENDDTPEVQKLRNSESKKDN